jgi:hypothetical protein
MNSFYTGKLQVHFNVSPPRISNSHAHLVVSTGLAGGSASLQASLPPSDLPCRLQVAPPLKNIKARYDSFILTESSFDVDAELSLSPEEIVQFPVLTARTDDCQNEVVLVSFLDWCDAAEVASQWPEAEVVLLEIQDIAELAKNILKLPLMVVSSGYPDKPLSESIYRRVALFSK